MFIRFVFVRSAVTVYIIYDTHKFRVYEENKKHFVGHPTAVTKAGAAAMTLHLFFFGLFLLLSKCKSMIGKRNTALASWLAVLFIFAETE